MFFRFALPCLLLVVAASAMPIGWDDVNKIPSSIRQLIPTEVRDFYKGLSEEDKTIISKLAGQAKEWQHEGDAIEALKEKSESLYNRAKVVYDLVMKKIDSLEPKANAFIIESFKAVKSLHRPGQLPELDAGKKLAKETFAKFLALSEESKESLKTAFPQIAKFLTNPKIQSMIEKVIQN